MQTVNEILKKFGLDFTIEKAPLVATLANKKQVLTPYFGLYNSKTGEVINTVKAGYGVSQNADLVEMILEGTKKFTNDLKVSKAGSLHGGRQVYMQMEINGVGKVGDDIIKRYVTIIDSNDGSTSLSVGIGDLTMSCENQFYRFYKAGEAKFRHTATIPEKIKSIPNLIEIALNQSLRQIEVYNEFLFSPVTARMADELVKEILGYDRVITSIEDRAKLTTRSTNRMDSLYNHIEKEIAGKGMHLWGLHSGVTSWTTHDKKGPKRKNGKEESMIIGSSYKDNITSFNFVSKKAKLLVEA